MSGLKDQNWDVIVIGTGIGGGTAGRKIAEAGLKVLFVEKGPVGFRAEQTQLSHEVFVPEARLARGFWPQQMHATVNKQTSQFFGPLGAGVGGSSAFYAATLERPEPHDLNHTNARPHPTGGWPIDFASFEPYLSEAERIYHVRGSQDPLSDSPATLEGALHINEVDKAISDRLCQAGMHPYQLHSAVQKLEGCQNCFGRKCPKTCKMDGRSAGVEPALATGNAAILDMTSVTQLCGDGERITHLKAQRSGEVFSLTAPTILLAGGAFGSPKLCLNSASESFPNGVANESGLVGRGLMFHLNEMFAVWPGLRNQGASKTVGFRDLIWAEETRLGMVQAMGISASYSEILHFLRLRLARTPLGKLRLMQEAARLPASLASYALGNAQIFVGLLEDLPFEHNRVLANDSDDIHFEYTISKELEARRKLFRRLIKQAFKGQRNLFLSNAPELNYGHPSGTMRFGNDPKTSVLDQNGQAHGIHNLFVADSGFMPTSMGVNPSLSIAAQALRTAEAIIKGKRSI